MCSSVALERGLAPHCGVFQLTGPREMETSTWRDEKKQILELPASGADGRVQQKVEEEGAGS